MQTEDRQISALQEVERQRAELRDRAQQLWSTSKAASVAHPFFEHWGVAVTGLKCYEGDLAIDGVSCDGLLMVPMRDSERQVANIAFVDGRGTRRYLSRDHILGLYFGMGPSGGHITITEGFLRGCRFHAAHGGAVAIAFIAENVPEVVSIMCSRYPDTRILVVARDGTIATIEATATVALPNESLPSLPPDQPLVAAQAAAAQRNGFLVPDSPEAKIVAWASRRGLTEFTRKQVLQLGPSGLRKAEIASPALQKLVELGRLHSDDGRRYRVTRGAIGTITCDDAELC
jgi:phage/plasmid primase-like uncharacterized protein